MSIARNLIRLEHGFTSDAPPRVYLRAVFNSDVFDGSVKTGAIETIRVWTFDTPEASEAMRQTLLHCADLAP